MIGELVKVKTNHNFDLFGFLVTPSQPTSKIVLYVHGRGGNFYDGAFLDSLRNASLKNGFACLTTNGQDSGWWRIWENFEESVFDLDTWIKFCQNRKFTQVILAAHSYGPIKIAYYYRLKHPSQVIGLIFLSHSDTYHIWKSQVGDKAQQHLNTAKSLLPESLMPTEAYYKPISAQSYLSLYSPNTRINIFNREFFSQINLPVLAVQGSKDIHPHDKTPQQKIDELKSWLPKFTGCILDGADHSFNGKETELEKIISDWLAKNYGQTD